MEGERTPVPGWHCLGRFSLLAAAYFVAGRAGLQPPFAGSQIALLWLRTGIAVGVPYRWGYPYWPAIPVAAVLVNIAVGVPLHVAFAISIGNTLGPLLTTGC